MLFLDLKDLVISKEMERGKYYNKENIIMCIC